MCCIWRFPEVGVARLIIHSIFGCSTIFTNQLRGHPDLWKLSYGLDFLSQISSDFFLETNPGAIQIQLVELIGAPSDGTPYSNTASISHQCTGVIIRGW